MPKAARNVLHTPFYRQDAQTVARGLLGAVLAHRIQTADGERILRARIVETEAYVGPHDLACHASKGRTKRTEVMFWAGGHAYVYFIYGMYEMLNVVTGDAGNPQAVLIRAAEPLDGFGPMPPDLSGPGKLTRAMQITRALNGEPLSGGTLWIEPRAAIPPRIDITPRIGVDYAGEWKDKPLRFLDAESPAVSGKRKIQKARTLVRAIKAGGKNGKIRTAIAQPPAAADNMPTAPRSRAP